jgi:hypothetical protein
MNNGQLPEAPGCNLAGNPKRWPVFFLFDRKEIALRCGQFKNEEQGVKYV